MKRKYPVELKKVICELIRSQLVSAADVSRVANIPSSTIGNWLSKPHN